MMNNCAMYPKGHKCTSKNCANKIKTDKKMTLQEIKQAIEQGKTVYWSTGLYKVIKDSKDNYLIKCSSNGSCIGLTYADGNTLNGMEKDFFCR